MMYAIRRGQDSGVRVKDTAAPVRVDCWLALTLCMQQNTIAKLCIVFICMLDRHLLNIIN